MQMVLLGRLHVARRHLLARPTRTQKLARSAFHDVSARLLVNRLVTTKQLATLNLVNTPFVPSLQQ